MVAARFVPSHDKVLIVDDDRMVLQSLDMLFAHYGWDVVTVTSGKAALDSLPCGDFRLVVVDHLMEGMTGVELVRRLKDSSSAAVFMLTGCIEPNLRAAAEIAGVDRFFVKPVQTSTMLKALEDL